MTAQKTQVRSFLGDSRSPNWEKSFWKESLGKSWSNVPVFLKSPTGLKRFKHSQISTMKTQMWKYYHGVFFLSNVSTPFALQSVSSTLSCFRVSWLSTGRPSAEMSPGWRQNEPLIDPLQTDSWDLLSPAPLGGETKLLMFLKRLLGHAWTQTHKHP